MQEYLNLGAAIEVFVKNGVNKMALYNRLANNGEYWTFSVN